MMRVLPSRSYGSDSVLRSQWFDPESVRHPAKMNLSLCRDLFLRYTLPGQVILDPFGGIGGSLVGTTLEPPRDVILSELEPPFAGLAGRNWVRIQEWHATRGGRFGVPLGQAWIIQGDSRRLPLPDAGVWGVLGSSPFGEMNAMFAGGAITQRPATDGAGFDGDKAHFIYSTDPANIGNLRYGDIAAVISSPVYADLAQRNRSQEGYALSNPEREREYGGGANRHIDGYGAEPGQIGNLPPGDVDAVVSSPVYAESEVLSWQPGQRGSAGKMSQRHISNDVGYGGEAGQLGRLHAGDVNAVAAGDLPPAETWASACLSIYRECWRVVRPGGVMVLVTGNYIRAGKEIDLAADTIKLARAAGWLPVERWRAEKSSISFWRHLHARQRPDVPVITSEDVLVFAKGHQGWIFAQLPPTTAGRAIDKLRQRVPAVPVAAPLAMELGV